MEIFEIAELKDGGRLCAKETAPPFVSRRMKVVEVGSLIRTLQTMLSHGPSGMFRLIMDLENEVNNKERWYWKEGKTPWHGNRTP